MTSVNDLPAKWRSEINGCAIENCAHCLSLAVALNELEAALAQQAGAADDAARLDWLSQQFRTCTVRMNGDHPWSPGHKVRDLKGQTFRDAIDRAMGAASSGPGGGGEGAS
jgi:hypothetical protein